MNEDEIRRAAEAAVAGWALVQEHVTRYARPDERAEVGQRINPDTAEVFFEYRQVLDPYDEKQLLPEEYCVGRIFFAVDPAEGVAVCFYDLPEATRDALERSATGQIGRAGGA